MDRRISAAGLELVKSFEGLRLQSYRDTGGVLTIGYGHTGPDVKPGMVITVAKAEQYLRDDLAEAEDAVSKFITVPLNDNQFVALVSFTFNVGREAFRRSTLRKKLNAGDYDAVPGQLARWVNDNGKKINGLVRRRKAEADLWNTPFVAAVPPEPPTDAHKPVPAPQQPELPKPAPAAPHGGLAAAIAIALGGMGVLWAWAASLPCDLLGLFCK